MKNSSSAYQLLSKASAILLLTAFLLPAGLQAKQLADFCSMEMSSHETTTVPCHDCCDSESQDSQESEHQHHDCDWSLICACNIGQSFLSDEEWVLPVKDFTATLTETNLSTPVLSADETIRFDYHKRIGEHDPPLWLLYDTFLN